MSHNDTIAIIIPAYKSVFLKEAIESVRNQNDNNYHLYIFNDASRDSEIESIVSSFKCDNKLSYFCFKYNMGQKSLPNHWNRCIKKTKKEDWIWLFSDDDLMDNDCIKNFRLTLNSNQSTRLLRFNTIKFQCNTVLRLNTFPDKISVSAWLAQKHSYQQESYVVEYIFKRSLYEQIGGFSNFPLGWCADDWFWVQALNYSDLITIPHSLVYWRYSDNNISGCKITPQIAKSRIQACSMYLEKLYYSDAFQLNENIELLIFKWANKQLFYLKDFLESKDILKFRAKIKSLIK